MLRVLSGIRGGRLEIADAGGLHRFGPQDAELRARVEIADRRAYRWALRGSTGFGEGYVDAAVGHRRSGRALPDRLPQPAAARSPARPLAAAAAPRAEPRRAGPPQHPQRRRPPHLRPLRPRRGAVRGLPRPAAGLLVRRVRGRADDARGGAAGEAGARLHGARPPQGRPPARDRHRLGRARRPRRRDPRLPGDDDDDLPQSARLRDRASARRGARRPSRGPARPTTATSPAPTTSWPRSR